MLLLRKFSGISGTRNTYANCIHLLFTVHYTDVKIFKVEGNEEKSVLDISYSKQLEKLLWYGNWNTLAFLGWGEEVSVSSEKNLRRKFLLCRNVFSSIEKFPKYSSRLQILKKILHNYSNVTIVNSCCFASLVYVGYWEAVLCYCTTVLQ